MYLKRLFLELPPKIYWTPVTNLSFLLPQNDPLPGRISARIGFTDKELPFGEKDTKSKVTLLEGDHIQFNISTDRRDKLERATNIDILPDTFNFTKETREMVRITNNESLLLKWSVMLCNASCWKWKMSDWKGLPHSFTEVNTYLQTVTQSSSRGWLRLYVMALASSSVWIGMPGCSFTSVKF